MRVLTYLHSFEPGGVERIALRLVRQWRALGLDAPLVLGRSDGAMAADVGAGLARIVPRAPLATARWETLWLMLVLPRIVRRLRPDVIFCAGNTYAVVALALRLRLGRRCPPIVAKVSNDLARTDQAWPARLGYRLWLRVQGRFVARFVGMAPPMRAEIAAAMAVPAATVAVVPDPALSEPLLAALGRRGPARAGPARAQAPGRRFVAVGRLAPQKNLPLMLRGFARGSGAADRLTLIGDGPERGRLTRLAARLGIAERVDFAGYRADPAVSLRAHDVLLLSSNYEGVPAVVLEALAAGLAVVATDCSTSMADLLGHGRFGTLVPVGDAAGFAAAVAAARPAAHDAAALHRHLRPFTVEAAAVAYRAVFAATLVPGATAVARGPLSLSRSEGRS